MRRSALILFFLIQVCGFAQVDGPVTRETSDSSDAPALNDVIMDYVNDHLGKKVESGQCWDLAAKALESANAKWDGLYVFGDVVDHESSPVLPGDIIQLEGVLIVIETPSSMTEESMGHHTAIIYAVHGPGQYTLAHQNFGKQKKTVGLTELDIRHIVAGEFTIFRPVQ